jgi:hypothetical protein
MWPVEAIPWVSLLRAVDLWFPDREAWPLPVVDEGLWVGEL